MDTVFSQVTNVQKFQLSGLLFASISTSQRFGYLLFEYWADMPEIQQVWVLDGCVISDTTYGSVTSASGLPQRPSALTLYPNYPNPFNPSTRIRYTLPVSTHVTLVIYDILGQEVIRLVDNTESVGMHEVTWNGISRNGQAVASGLYFYRLTTPTASLVRKMNLSR
ncbi:MAG TPA: T9SS type A sorting domain-containing protein [Bacteroidota bacterium]|nr:T9SS type A sorting domain-containing protein [Bacteroidota bacterium]